MPTDRPPHHLLLTALGFTFALATIGAAAEYAVPPTSNEDAGTHVEERQDRAVDEAALTSQAEATGELREMVAKYKNTPREGELLERLAEVQQQSAAMEFRVAHGRTHSDGKPVNLARYRSVMGGSIPTLTRLIEKYSNSEGAPHAYYMRGVAYQETLDLASAKKDFTFLTRTYPASPEAMPAFMTLGEFAMDKNQYAEAVEDFKAIIRHPEDAHYPHALYKTAWSQYNLKHTDAALTATESLVHYLRDKTKNSPSDQGILENILKDVPLFYFGGYQLGQPNYTVAKALPFFKSLDQGDAFGHMLVEFANLLRTHDREKDLFAWKDMVTAAEPNRPETYDLLLMTFDYQLNRMSYAELTTSVREIVKIYPKHREGEEGKRAQKMLLDASITVQKLIQQQPARKDEYARYLTVIYAGFTEIAGENDHRVRTIHGDLAETYFSIKDYEHAVENYRWVVTHGGWSDHGGGISGADASLKAIAARYETLRERKLVPGELKAVARSKSDLAKAPALLTEWVGWIDEYAKHAQADNFEFEANRCLYAQGEVNQATDRLHAFALRRPDSHFAVPAATLVIDTEIASGNWEHLYVVLNEFLHVSPWKNTAFHQRAYTLAANTKLKMAQSYAKAGNHAEAMAQADDFIKNYRGNEHLIDALTLAGKSAVATNDRDRAISYFAAIAAAAPGKPTGAQALLAKAKIEDERYAFADAARTYQAYLAFAPSATRLSESRRREIKLRVLSYAWLSGDAILLDRSLASRQLCTKDLRDDCERYYALRALGHGQNAALSRQALKSARRSIPSVRPLWAAVALQDATALTVPQRHEMIHLLATEWKHADELSRFTALPSISASVPAVFALDRAAIQRSGKLKIDSATLTRRLRSIQEVEKYATEAARLPWSRIRALVLNEMASIYTDLASGMRALPYPVKIRTPRDRDAYHRMIEQAVSPFDQKSFAIRSEAYRLASQTSVEPEVYGLIARAYFQEEALPTPDSGKKPAIPRQRYASAIDLSLVKSVDDHGWRAGHPDNAGAADLLRARWAQALAAKNWPQVGYFAQEAKQKALLKPEVTEVAKAVSLAAAGAKAEGAMELADVCRSDAHLGSACNDLKENL